MADYEDADDFDGDDYQEVDEPDEMEEIEEGKFGWPSIRDKYCIANKRFYIRYRLAQFVKVDLIQCY